ncbi:hypothetical protein [Ottowia sp.]|uniref:hypothetical protein n=1 Tax=Ottowia sp. TaxID=1898956 RepID=UPI0026204894|nr:hypothetical protein [Ottowia sp.]
MTLHVVPTTPADTATFSLWDAAHLLHTHVYGPGEPAIAGKAQHSAFSSHLDQINAMAADISQLGSGLDMFLRLLSDAASSMGMEPVHAKAIAGLLTPVQRELERHANCLNSMLCRTAD